MYMATDVDHGRKIALKVQQPGKKFCQVALDEVALLSHVTRQRALLLSSLPPGASASLVANAAAALLVSRRRHGLGIGDEETQSTGGGTHQSAVTEEMMAHESAKAAALDAAAVAGAECVVRFYGHAVHKSGRGSLVCIQMEALGPSLLDLLRHRQYRGVGMSGKGVGGCVGRNVCWKAFGLWVEAM